VCRRSPHAVVLPGREKNVFERIMLPLDGSEISEMALIYGEEFSKKLGSELVLFHVHGPESEQYRHMHQTYLDRIAETMRSRIGDARPEGKEVRITARVEAGWPQESICNLVKTNDIDLIVMASVSVSGLKVAKLLGSVADHVCRTVPIPVMLIRPQSLQQVKVGKSLINQILIPLDGSELSRMALPVGKQLAAKLNAGIVLFEMVHMIVPTGSAAGYADYVDYADYAKFTEIEEKRVRDELIALEKELREEGLTVTSNMTTGLNAAADIIEVGKRVGADLVVMSTHGRSGLSRWILGNVAEKVLRHGEIPLLLVNARAN
jgi:nucleotide-binding universal stress UspA family protein